MGEKPLQSRISSVSMSTVRLCRKFHSMIYYINYSHVGFMPLRLKMQPHSKVDLKYILAKMKVLLIVINGVQYLLSCSILLPLECLISFLWLEIKFEIWEASSSFYSLLSSGLLSAFSVVTEWSISFMCEACLNSLFLSKWGLGHSCPWLAELTTRLIKSHLGCYSSFLRRGCNWGEPLLYLISKTQLS